MLLDLKEVEKFFFEAMVNGYAFSGGRRIQIPEMPEYKAIVFEKGYFRLVDTWCVNPDSSKSAGTTTIWFEGIPVWFMSYGGYYDNNVIPLLKKALYQAYQECRFFGGRGVSYAEGKLFYLNFPHVNYFSKFNGREEIQDQNRTLLGYHNYWGMSLI